MSLGLALRLSTVALLVMVINVACSILYMVLYGHVIDPGHDGDYYTRHVQVAAPYCSIVAGMPLMFLAGWWVTGWSSVKYSFVGASVVWLTYFLVDLTILLAAGISNSMAGLFAVSFLTKLLAAWYGARIRRRGFMLESSLPRA